MMIMAVVAALNTGLHPSFATRHHGGRHGGGTDTGPSIRRKAFASHRRAIDLLKLTDRLEIGGVMEIMRGLAIAKGNCHKRGVTDTRQQ